MTEKPVKNVLFVCTGNTCRSVMAQWYLTERLRRAGIDTVKVESAGVRAVEGMRPTQETQRVLEAVGILCGSHQARRLTPHLIEQADLILTMESWHAEEITRLVPSAHEKTHLLKPYALHRSPAGEALHIPDPIGKPLEVYEVCLTDIRAAVDRVAKTFGVPQPHVE